MNYKIRKMMESEYPLLNDFLYEAIFVPEDIKAPGKSIINAAELQVYISDFGNGKDDFCFVVEVNENVGFEIVDENQEEYIMVNYMRH